MLKPPRNNKYLTKQDAQPFLHLANRKSSFTSRTLNQTIIRIIPFQHEVA